jgi:hypothetical protein
MPEGANKHFFRGGIDDPEIFSQRGLFMQKAQDDFRFQGFKKS